MIIHQFTGGPKPAEATRVAALWPFRSDSLWNLPLANSAVFVDDPNIRLGGAGINSTTWTTRIHQAKNSDPLVTVTGNGTIQLRVGSGITSSNGTDGDLDVIGPDGHTHWDFYKFIRVDDNNATMALCRQNALSDVLNGTGWGDADTATWAGTTAAGACFMGGVMRKWELNTPTIDRIKHCLPLSLGISQLKAGTTKAQTFQYPAISADGSWYNYYGTIPIGALLAIPPDVDIGALGLSNDALSLAWTLQNFGAYVVNKGGSGDAACITYAETESPEAIVNNMRAGWPAIRNRLRLVGNNTKDTPAGKTATGSYPSSLYPAPTPIAVPSE